MRKTNEMERNGKARKKTLLCNRRERDEFHRKKGRGRKGGIKKEIGERKWTKDITERK